MSSAVAMTIDRTLRYQFILAIFSDGFDDTSKKNAAAQLTRIWPHLKRVAQYYRTEPDIQAVTELNALIGEVYDINLLIVGDAGRVKSASKAVDTILRQTSVFNMTSYGAVSLREEQAQSVLSNMLSHTYRGPKVINLVSQGTRLKMIRMQKDAVSMLFEGATVMVLIEPLVKKNTIDILLFANMYKLTKSEVRALEGILSGKSIQKIAAELSLSNETIRTQMKGLFAKTGTAGQLDLLRLVAFGEYTTDDD